MKIIKHVAMRAFDFAIIGALVFGDERLQEFGLWVAALFTVVAWLGIFAMKPEAAKEIHGGPLKVGFGVVVNIGYTYGLIVSGAPIWAAFYCVGFILFRSIAAKVANAPTT